MSLLQVGDHVVVPNNTMFKNFLNHTGVIKDVRLVGGTDMYFVHWGDWTPEPVPFYAGELEKIDPAYIL